MATELLATGDAAASSPEFTLASGETASLVVRNAAGNIVSLFVEQKDELNNWTVIGELPARSRVLLGPGTFRVRREAGKVCGVFRG